LSCAQRSAISVRRFDTPCVSYFTRRKPGLRSDDVLGDDVTISKNNETISNPAIIAPINIGDPILQMFDCCVRMHVSYQVFST
jgi:hypothetical protein